MTWKRTISAHYSDPVDRIWLTAAEELGLRVERAEDVYASYDGRGTLRITRATDFDADDSLAQLVFHELCHAAVAGEHAFEMVDWGLCNDDDRDVVREHACHRLQAQWARRHGLRQLLSVTTDHRPYWDALPEDPLSGDEDPATPMARAAWIYARSSVLWSPIERALDATRRIADVVQPAARGQTSWTTVRPRHSTGLPRHASAELRCGDCAWSFLWRGATRCRQTGLQGRGGLPVAPDEPACERWEPCFDAGECGRCGACCREGYHVIWLRPGERFAARHPELTASDDGQLVVPRPAGRCVALTGDGGASEPYRCRAYADRPSSCRDFPVRGQSCLEARQRVGLSR
ncbi:MAG: YkgJ family cysteine cluster protein [Polyangiaceae bacterium]|nr:YkgJ family cysteine cluster protein [Polyangiaceae bacterium]